jgi:hypothetical protein
MEIEETYRREIEDNKDDNRENSGYAQGKGPDGEKVQLLDGVNVSKRALWLMAGGAVGALAVLGLGRAFNAVRPMAVGALKEGYGFKEWMAGKLEAAKEDIEDIVAEAVFSYQKDVAAAADVATREKELLARVEKLVEQKMAGSQRKE